MMPLPADSNPDVWRHQIIPEVPDEYIGVKAAVAYAAFLIFLSLIEYYFFVAPFFEQLQTDLFLRP